MPALTLVVCLYNQRDLLERLLRESAGCYDDLVVVHDGPDIGGARSVVESAGGRFLEGRHAFQQEPHMPLAFEQARHDWILKLDADEFPSAEMKTWLRNFRLAAEIDPGISGYTCIWPMWNGREAVAKKIFDGRIFLYDRRQVRFFGMVEQAVVPDGRFQAVDLVLHHQSKRKCYGVRNILMREQAYHWRECIARSLLGRPTNLACWRWTSENWPPEWEQIRRHPLQTAVRRMVMETFRGLRSQWRAERKFFPLAAVGGPLHHALICLKYWQMRRQRHGKATGKQL